MAGEPSLHDRRLVRRQVIQHHMDLEGLVNLRVDFAEELDEVDASVLLLAASDDVPSGDVQGGKEIERPVAEIVAGPALRLADVHRQDGLGPLECLNLRCLVEGEDSRVLRRIHVQTYDVAYLLDELRIW